MYACMFWTYTSERERESLTLTHAQRVFVCVCVCVCVCVLCDIPSPYASLHVCISVGRSEIQIYNVQACTSAHNKKAHPV
jgi:hypothetical protein